MLTETEYLDIAERVERLTMGDRTIGLDVFLADFLRLMTDWREWQRRYNQAHREVVALGQPCECDPPFSGEEFCNGACELRAALRLAAGHVPGASPDWDLIRRALRGSYPRVWRRGE